MNIDRKKAPQSAYLYYIADNIYIIIVLFFLQFTGKRGRAHSDRSYSSEHESAEQGGQACHLGEFSEAKSRLLLPPIILEPEKEQSATTTTSKLLKNGSEFRRSLRRINSLTRRKLSPSTHNAPEVRFYNYIGCFLFLKFR